MSGSLGDNKFFKFASSVANVLLAVSVVLLFLAVFHLVDMRSTAVSVVLCAIMVMTAVAVACAIIADTQVKREKNNDSGLSANSDAANNHDGESNDQSNQSVDA